MTDSRKLMALVLFGLLAAAACDPGSDASPEGADGDRPALQQQQGSGSMMLMLEMNQLQQRLEPIRQRAMQDEELVRHAEELRARLDSTLRDENAELLERMEALRTSFIAAREAGDAERADEIGRQAQDAQAEIEARQQGILDRPEIRAAIEAFQEAQRAKMIEIDPDAREMLARLEEIGAQADRP